MAEPRDELDHEILALHAQGLTDTEMAEKVGRPRRTIGGRVKRLGLTSNTLRSTRSVGVTRSETTSSHPVQELDIDRISSDAATQMRVRLSPQTIDEYAEALEQGEVFPPIVVFQEGETYWTADGWHRVEATRQLGVATILGEVRPGGLDDAIDFACGANTRHGLRLTIEDRRKAVRAQLERHPDRSDRAIARLCGCSPTSVGIYRTELNTQRQAPPSNVQMDSQPAEAADPTLSPAGVQMDTLVAHAVPVPAPQKDRLQAPVETGDTLQAHLDPEQVTDMAPIFRRRELAPGELEAATKSLAEGEELPAICRRLGVTPATLRRQVLAMLWESWCEAHGLEKSGGPQALDF